MKKILLLCIACMALSSFMFSQNRSWQGGIQLNSELTLWNGIASGAGLQLVYRGKKKAGFETGIAWQHRFYRNVFAGPVPNQVSIYDHRLQIPLLYRNHGKLLNFSAGPVIDLYVGSNIVTSRDIQHNDYGHLKSRILALVATSHTFRLKKGLIIEPSLSFAYKYYEDGDDDGGPGIHIAFRKRIF